MDLNNLRKSMKKTTFKKLEFKDNHRQAVLEKIAQLSEIEDVRLAVLQLLMQQKTGYELTQLLLARGMKGIERNEGALYALLHQLEQEGQVYAHWSDEGEKFYVLSKQGEKLLKKPSSNKFARKILLQG
ncbi:PadR family transcriptional regulator [Lysinibacillus sp. NPDC096418]|uniref:PadR family transcriptional regulator n=1 Tax=Lysinibacillus sp. NPDC096418 TaxID=3364138 RepID=UPI00381EB811